MGTAPSRFDETDWDKADGGLAEDSNGIAGNAPTSKKHTILLKKDQIMNHRNYHILDEDKVILVSKGLAENREWFDLQTPDGKQTLCRARKIMLKNSWIIYQAEHPAFEDQEPDKEATPDGQLVSVDFYRAYKVELDVMKNNARVFRFVKNMEGSDKLGVQSETVLVIERAHPVKEKYQISLPGKTELCSHWHWDNTTTEHKIELTVAKGCDIAFHVMCATLVNIVKEDEKFPFVGMVTN